MGKKKLCGKQLVQQYWRRVEKKLLQIEGHRAIAPKVDPQLFKILQEGYVHDGMRLRCPGKPGQCHRNSAAVWIQNHGRVSLCTGYAQSSGVWVQHSWCSYTHKGESVIWETTPVERSTYYGVSLSDEEACRFWMADMWTKLTAKEQKDLFKHQGKDIEWVKTVFAKVHGGEVT